MRRFESSHPSHPVGSLWFGFPVCKKLRYFRGLGFQAEVSGRKSSNSGSPAAGFTPPVSARHFPISAMGVPETGSRCARERFGKLLGGTPCTPGQVQSAFPAQPCQKTFMGAPAVVFILDSPSPRTASGCVRRPPHRKDSPEDACGGKQARTRKTIALYARSLR
jgi:hypothetical protein